MRIRRISRDVEGEFRELTFSCYQSRPLFELFDAYADFVLALDAARLKHQFWLASYVVMPNHAHVLLLPKPGSQMKRILADIKRPVAQIVLRRILDDFAADVTHRTSTGRSERRFWQVGGGYDRNFFSNEALLNSVNYIHQNPVRKGLCLAPEDYIWSSLRELSNPGEGTIRVQALADIFDEWDQQVG